MKTTLLLMMASLMLPMAQTNPQKDPGITFITLDVKIEMRKEVTRPPVVSQKPPEVNPNLGRGTADAVDSRQAADLKDKWEDRQRRREGLEATTNKQEGIKRQSTWPAYIFKAQVRNTTSKAINSFVWEYHPPESYIGPQEIPDFQYLCNVAMAPGQTKFVQVVSRIPRPRVVDASSPSPPGQHQPALDDLIINQIQFADNDKWQRADWNALVMTHLGARKVGKGKCIQL